MSLPSDCNNCTAKKVVIIRGLKTKLVDGARTPYQYSDRLVKQMEEDPQREGEKYVV